MLGVASSARCLRAVLGVLAGLRGDAIGLLYNDEEEVDKDFEVFNDSLDVDEGFEVFRLSLGVVKSFDALRLSLDLDRGFDVFRFSLEEDVKDGVFRDSLDLEDKFEVLTNSLDVEVSFDGLKVPFDALVGAKWEELLEIVKSFGVFSLEGRLDDDFDNTSFGDATPDCKALDDWYVSRTKEVLGVTELDVSFEDVLLV